ncbi:hypothetical protein LGL55_18415 [Clostridium tagluense]|nr:MULTISPECIES: hypothetical protein [Clostridium]MBW9154323.1 hypothetical protein [Clostridium estertheticum]MCB2313250.1 hypothetical protein [Clostridium tagluense]MCB2322805.1 hypothetical protein [Clostridium tagluense]MCB2327783.1 hypothetical protein [Clostridium tagluense]MCB2332430.1 hypothetical protein [Clostridium tagluense]
MMRDEMLNAFLKGVKKTVSKSDNWFNGDREKNSKFLRDNGLTIDHVKEAIMRLNDKSKPKGPEEDRDGYPGFIYKFKSEYLTDKVIYIKIRFYPPNEVMCISFHEDEPKNKK